MSLEHVQERGNPVLARTIANFSDEQLRANWKAVQNNQQVERTDYNLYLAELRKRGMNPEPDEIGGTLLVRHPLSLRSHEEPRSISAVLQKLRASVAQIVAGQH